MKFKNSSLYVQRQTNYMFRSYRKFSRVFVNDIVIFSHILKKHLQHLHQIFRLFQIKRINLTFTKFFLNYSFIILIDQRIDNLKLFIFVEKIAKIISLQFLKSFKNLNYFLKLIDWFRYYVKRYVQLIQSFIARKTILIKLIIIINENVKKRQSIQFKLMEFIVEKLKFFNKLQHVFFELIFFIHFDSNRRLYIDLNAFKRWSFVVMIYHVVEKSKNVIFSRIDIQSIFF